MNYALIGTVIISVSTLGGWLLIRWKFVYKSKQVKWALFVLYFWGLNFIQLIFLAAAHYLLR